MLPRPNRPLSAWRRLVASVGVGLIRWLDVLAASPEAHAWMHVTSGNEHAGHGCKHDRPQPAPEHTCVVEAFAHGHADVGGAPTAVPVLVLREEGETRTGLVLPAPAGSFRLPPGCGPPPA